MNVWEEEQDCPECDGEGVIWFIDSLDYNGSMTDHEEECPVCNGDGKVWVTIYDTTEEEEEEDNI